MDELFSLTTSEENIGTILRLLWSYTPSYYDHPPLYFILLHSVLYWGNSPLLLRLISIVSMGLVAGVWAIWILQRYNSLLYAILIIPLMLVHPAAGFQATYVRMYALFMFLTSSAVLLALRIPTTVGRERIASAIGVAFLIAASIYTSYFGLMFTLGIALLGVTWIVPPSSPPAQRSAGRYLVAACVAGIVLTIPWLPAIFRLMTTPGGHRLFPTTRFQQMITVLSEIGGTWAFALYCGAGIVFLVVFSSNRSRWIQLLCFLFIIPLVILVVFTPDQRNVMVRYILFALPVIIVAGYVGWIHIIEHVCTDKKRRVISLLVITLLALLINAHHLYTKQLASLPDWWAAAEIIEHNAASDEIILTGGVLSGEAIVYHLENPADYSFIHYVTKYEKFVRHCRDPRVVWYINAAPLPEEYRAAVDRYFPYRVRFPGNRGICMIEIFSKTLFTLPDGTPAPHEESQIID